MKTYTVMFLLLVSASAFTQTATTTSSEPLLGMTRLEVLAAIGEPTMVYAFRYERYYPAQDRLNIMSDGSPTADVYMRKYGGMDFEVKVKYSFDATTSRLHPSERVERVIYKPDQNRPVGDIVKLLPQMKMLCAQSCSLLSTTSGTLYVIYVYADSPTPSEIALSNEVARGFEPGGTDGYHWQPCLKVVLQARRAIGDNSPMPSLDGLPVDAVSVEVVDPKFEKQTSRGLFHEETGLHLQ